MAGLFQASKQSISLHINNCFKEGELDKNAVVKESLTTASDGKSYKTKYYNLDVIISVGYRVKSLRGTLLKVIINVLADPLIGSILTILFVSEFPAFTLSFIPRVAIPLGSFQR